MSERLVEEGASERTILPASMLPSTLSGHAGIERVLDERGKRYYGLKRTHQLKTEDVERAFEDKPGTSFEYAIQPSLELEELRRQFEEYKKDTDERITNLEAANAELLTQLRNVEAEKDELAEQNSLLKQEAGIPEPRQSNNRFKRRWNRFSGRVGGFVLGKQAELHNGLYRYTDRRGKKVIVHEEVVDDYPESDRRAGAAVVVGVVAVAATAVGAYLLGRYTGSIDGLTEDQAQALIDQNKDILENQADILENQTEVIDNQETIINNQEAHVADMESQHSELSTEHNDLDQDIQQHTNKNTQDHRELHGDIHPDPSMDGLGASETSGEAAGATGADSDGNGSAGASGENDSNRGSHTEYLEFRSNNIWSDVSDQLKQELGYEPSNSQVRKATQHVLDINGLSWNDARHLPVGFSYKMPNNLASVIN